MCYIYLYFCLYNNFTFYSFICCTHSCIAIINALCLSIHHLFLCIALIYSSHLSMYCTYLYIALILLHLLNNTFIYIFYSFVYCFVYVLYCTFFLRINLVICSPFYNVFLFDKYKTSNLLAKVLYYNQNKY